MTTPPEFDDAFRARFEELLRWRRDVRAFRRDLLPAGSVEELVALAQRAPSVGFSQPWRFVRVDDVARRAAVRAEFERANVEALSGYDGDRARLYASLKLSGLDDAPVQLAVLCDAETTTGKGLGRRTMPETLRDSTVLAVHTLWLAARARGIGVGWVSILDPRVVERTLAVPETWRLVAWLCLGVPDVERSEPELARLGWEGPDCAATDLHQR